MIIKDLFSNLAILTTLIFMYTQFTKSRPLNHSSTKKRRITIGVFGGLLGNILMLFSVPVGDALVDLRHIPIILLAFYAGSMPAYISMTLIILGRFLIGVNLSAVLAIPFMLLVTLGAVYISGMNLREKNKVIFMIAWNNIVFSIIASYLIKDINIILFLIPMFWLVSSLGGFIAFYTINYIRSIQLLFDKYKNESATDGLTGLNNYRKFEDIFNTLITTIDEKQEKLSLLYIDIDFFKKINDKYGHASGDEVLKELGNILQKSTRSFDIVSRNGGEEFTILLLDCPLDKATEIADRIRRKVEQHQFILSTETFHISVSIGVSCYNETTLHAINLIEDADKALYIAKKTGRNKVCIANVEETHYSLKKYQSHPLRL